MKKKIRRIKELRNSRNNYNYSQYVAEQIDKTISYADCLSENLNIVRSNSISYVEYISEAINR